MPDYNNAPNALWFDLPAKPSRWRRVKYVIQDWLPLMPLILIFGAIFGILGGMIVQDYRAYPSRLACRQQGLDYTARTPFSTTVTCVPVAGHRLDTLYIKTEAK